LQGNSKQLILCSLFAALTAICSMISIPLPFTPIPINLATLSVFLAGGLLGSKYGAISQFIYVLLGAIGLPIFHNFTGGFGILVGPTGGYIVGYIAGAWVAGFVIERWLPSNKGKLQYILLCFALLMGLFSCYLLGTVWFMKVSGANLVTALVSCVVPFLIGDTLKILAGSFLIQRLKQFV
ncbi:MAG: biotin transporter BioY, partial [Anaerovorax sp.]